MKSTTYVTAALAMLVIGATPSIAAVNAAEAAQLKSTLTPMGAEKAGNIDGSIPAWTGGITKAPAGYKSGDPRADQFAAEKPLFSITSKNVEQYAAKLTDGMKAILKRDPTYRLDVYPTHRTAAAPQWVYDNTLKNATRAKLIENGFGLEGAYGGVPFPIPKDGYELLWNHRLAWQGANVTIPCSVWTVMPGGRSILASKGEFIGLSPYYDKNGSLETFKNYYFLSRYIAAEPASKAGEAILAHDSVNSTQPRAIWQYLVGQRRVRRAPSVAYDTPDSVTSGMGTFDEAFGIFGPSDKHTWKIVGKKEIYIPYNNNRAALAKVADLMTPTFMNPNLVRWELHRVWVLEANLAPGKRHIMEKRVYYIDEDTWQIVTQDGFDAQRQLYHTFYALPYLAADIPAVTTTMMQGVINHQTGTYYANFLPNELPVAYKTTEGMSPNLFTPESLANAGVR